MSLLEIRLEIECRVCKKKGVIKVSTTEIELEDNWEICDSYYDEGSYLCKECFERDNE